MVEMPPKVLRFALLAAEGQPSMAADPQIDLIKEAERRFLSALGSGATQRSRYIRVSDETAAFCMQAFSQLLDHEETITALEFDGNDVIFVTMVLKALQAELNFTHHPSR